MGAREIAEAHQKLADDLAAGEHESLAEQLDPFFLRARVIFIEPGGERAMRRTQGEKTPCVLDRGVDLELVSDDPGIGEETLDVILSEGSDPIEIPAGERRG